MAEFPSDSDAAASRGQPLSTGQVMGFVARQWMRRPMQFTAMLALMLGAPFATCRSPGRPAGWWRPCRAPVHATHVAWRAWGVLSLLYLGFFTLRNIAFRVMNNFAARNMEELTNAAFERVQAFSTDWYADSFAGAIVRRVSRAMQGYDSTSDALFLMLGPSLVVLFGLAISIALRWPVAGLFCGAVVIVFMGYNLVIATRFIRPVNLRSNALDTEIGASLADAIGGAAVVKSFGAETREATRFATVTAAWRVATIRTWNTFNWPAPVRTCCC